MSHPLDLDLIREEMLPKLVNVNFLNIAHQRIKIIPNMIHRKANELLHTMLHQSNRGKL